MARGGAERTLQPAAASVGLARRFVARTLDEWGAPEYIDAAVSICSELATNVVLHARTAFTVRLHLGEGVLRLEVADESPRTPRPRRYSDDAATGRGLSVVDTLSSAWGTAPAGAGKCVWVELHAGDRGVLPGAPAAQDVVDLSGGETCGAPGSPGVARSRAA